MSILGCPSSGDRLRQLGVIVALSLGFLACGEDVAPVPGGDGDDQSSEQATSADDDFSDEDGDEGDGPSGPSEDDGPTGSTGGDAGAPPKQPKPVDGGGPDSLIDAGSEVPTGGEGEGNVDGGGEPFDPTETPADAGMPREDLGVGDGKDVVTIGDSWMDYFLSGGGIEAALRKEGKRYRNYSLSGTTLGSGAIPGQFDRAKRAGADIKTVIMTGGGNDIMFSGACNSNAENCADAGAMIVKMLNTLWTKMADEGVKDVVYIQYSSSAGTARMRPDGGASGMGAVVEVCTTGRIRCHSIPTSDLVSSRDLLDGIHPTSAANTRIAKRVLETMEKRGVRR